jgi:signal transduction histidine kinase
MRGLVADLLLLARADARRERIREPVDIGSVIRAAAGEAAPLAARHDLVVDVDNGLIVEGWRDDLHRLVLNLIENAIRHTPIGTGVRVSAHAPDLEHVRLVVEDEGPGCPEEIRDRAFERFVRGGGDGRPRQRSGPRRSSRGSRGPRRHRRVRGPPERRSRGSS